MSTFMYFIAILVIVFIVSVIFGIYQGNKHMDTIEKISLNLNKLEGFKTSNLYVPIDGKSAIAIDDKDEQICIVKNDFSFIPILFNYRDILSVEIIEDGESITKTSRSSQIGGALLGTVLLGGVGAVIGGLSGKKTTTDKVNSLILRVVVNDTKNPDYYISFLNSETKKQTTSTNPL